MKPRIVISAGDPAGVGPEVILKTFLRKGLYRIAAPVVIGDLKTFAALVRRHALPLAPVRVRGDALPASVEPGTVPVLDLRQLAGVRVRPGTLGADAGRASFRYFETAVRLCLEGRADAVVTAPINKEAWHTAGFRYDGHTGLLGKMCGTDDYAMMLTGKALTVVLVTTHCAYADAPRQLTVRRVLDKIRLAHGVLAGRGTPDAPVAVLGLNPHAGEGGVFGSEERKIIAPAVARANAEGIRAEGPFPPDTAFIPGFRERFGAFVCMYHDQGLIPLKMLCFADGVNVTLGLPVVRTSPDHGTAFNIAGQWRADERSMVAAVKEAVRLVKARSGITARSAVTSRARNQSTKGSLRRSAP